MIKENLNVLLVLVINMLYTFGDSVSSGFGFIEKGMPEKKARELSWPFLLSKNLNQELRDYTLPGCSNWSIARNIQRLPITSLDFVVIQWSSASRYEIGINDRFVYTDKKENPLYESIDKLEQNIDYRSKNICRSLISKTSDPVIKQYMNDTYTNFYNEQWSEDMFKVMLTSVCYTLDKIGCKYVMVDGWTNPCSNDIFNDIPQYVFRGTTLAHITRGFEGGIQLPNKEHGSQNEHMFLMELIEKKIKELYYSYNEDESCYIPELRKKYQLNTY